MFVDRGSRLWNVARASRERIRLLEARTAGPYFASTLWGRRAGRGRGWFRGHTVRLEKSGTKRGRWSRTDEARLRELYGLRNDAAIARELKRPVGSVHRMARKRFPQVVKSGPWTGSETLELKRYLGATTPEVIARILGRREEEVEAQIFDLGRIQGRGSWTRAEIR